VNNYWCYVLVGNWVIKLARAYGLTESVQINIITHIMIVAASLGYSHSKHGSYVPGPLLTKELGDICQNLLKCPAANRPP
jgi:hypothetical protein